MVMIIKMNIIMIPIMILNEYRELGGKQYTKKPFCAFRSVT